MKRNTTLRDFLRSRRARVTPQEAGVPPASDCAACQASAEKRSPISPASAWTWPSLTYARSVVYMRLESRGMAALFEVSLPHLEAWLLSTFNVVPPGTELDRTNWDLLVERLLDDA